MKISIQISFTGSDQADFLAGDTIGFTWTRNGPVSFEGSDEFNYCEDSVGQPAVGSQISLRSGQNGNRVYSFQAITRPAAGKLSLTLVLHNRCY